MRNQYWDTFGSQFLRLGEVLSKTSWLMRRKSNNIIRRLPFPKAALNLGWRYEEGKGGRWFGGWKEYFYEKEIFPFDHNRQWERDAETRLSAIYPHSWLLGQLKQVKDVETFADYNSNLILIPVFEFTHDYRLTTGAHFAFGRPAKWWLRATAP
jgi:hypothetical protein